MTEVIAILESHTKAARRPVVDLSAHIIDAVEKRRSDVVKCKRVFGNCYRCNWWAPDYTGESAVVTYTIRDSRLLRALKTRRGLQITDETVRRPKTNRGLAEFLR